MPRIVFFVLALFVLWRVLSSLGKRAAASGLGADSYSRFNPMQRRRRLDLEDEPRGRAPEELVECSRCGTYVPGGRAFVGGDGDHYCSRSCRDD